MAKQKVFKVSMIVSQDIVGVAAQFENIMMSIHQGTLEKRYVRAKLKDIIDSKVSLTPKAHPITIMSPKEAKKKFSLEEIETTP